jgi:hypothetical protein
MLAAVFTHRHVGLALQDQAHVDAAPRRAAQFLDEAVAGEEVRVGDHDALLRRAHRRAVVALDVVHVGAVVAHHEHQLGVAFVRLRFGRLRQLAGGHATIAALALPPMALGQRGVARSGGSRPTSGPVDFHRVVLLGLGAEVAQVVGRIVDAADERRSPSITAILRCMRRSKCGRQPKGAPGLNTCTRTPAPRSASRKRSERSGEPQSSIVMSTWAPRCAAAIMASCSCRPTLSSNRMKVSTITSRLALAMRANTRGKNCSPFSSSVMLVAGDPAVVVHGIRFSEMDLGRQGRVVGQVRPGPARQHHRQVHRAVAHVDAVERQDGEAPGRSWPARRGGDEDLAQAASFSRMSLARRRQSLKSPATISGASAGTSCG